LIFWFFWIKPREPAKEVVSEENAPFYNPIVKKEIKIIGLNGIINLRDFTDIVDHDKTNLPPTEKVYINKSESKRPKKIVTSVPGNTTTKQIIYQENQVKKLLSQLRKMKVKEILSFDMSKQKKKAKEKLETIYRELVTLYKKKNNYKKASEYEEILQILDENNK